MTEGKNLLCEWKSARHSSFVSLAQSIFALSHSARSMVSGQRFFQPEENPVGENNRLFGQNDHTPRNILSMSEEVYAKIEKNSNGCFFDRHKCKPFKPKNVAFVCTSRFAVLISFELFNRSILQNINIRLVDMLITAMYCNLRRP